MSDAEIPLARPVLGEAEERRVLEVLRSGRLSLGPLLGEFEQRFAQRIGSPHASAVSSGTAGLHLALRAVGVTDGDEVITSPFSFVASANVIVYERARPVFVDIDRRTLTIDPAAVAAAVSARGRARCCRSTSSAGRPTSRRSSRSGCRSSRTPARRSAQCMPTAWRSAPAAIRRSSRSTRTSS